MNERRSQSYPINQFQSLTKDAGTSDHRLELNTIVGVLRTLWDRIVDPIVKALKVLIPRGSRIGQGNPNKGTPILCVTDDLCDVASRVAPFLPLTSLSDNDATVQQALDALNRHQWIHLACHGMPNQQKPFESSFAMRDGPLSITDIIIRPRLQQPEFAFLSACHITVGHASSPDEAIHLAAAMQFSGFRSVIGSMWSVDDEVVGQVVSAFYDEMFGASGRLDYTRAAVALHKAMEKLRNNAPLEQ